MHLVSNEGLNVAHEKGPRQLYRGPTPRLPPDAQAAQSLSLVHETVNRDIGPDVALTTTTACRRLAIGTLAPLPAPCQLEWLPMREIRLGRSGLVALVDDEDYDLVRPYSWFIMRRPRGVIYARRQFSINGVRHEQRLHSLITGWKEVDHMNLDGLDNRRENLREADRSTNCANRRKPVRGRCGVPTSEYKGVWRSSDRPGWQASIMVHKKTRYLGSFCSEYEAARAYDAAALEAFGEFALLNFPYSSSI